MLWNGGLLGLAIIAGDSVEQANPRLLNWLGIEPEDISELSLSQLFVSERTLDAQTFDSGEPVLVTPRRNEGKLWLELSCLANDLGGRLLVIRDATQEHIRYNELQQKRAALEDSLNGYDIVDEHGRIVYANRAYLHMWGYDSLDEVLGKSPAEHCADPEVPERIVSALLEFGHTTLEFEGKRKDGSTFDVLMAAQVATDPHGNRCFVGTSLDVTDLKRLASELRHFQKMELMGRLAASVAHDFNNLLSPIMGFTELMLQDEVSSSHRDHLESMLSAAKHSRELTRQLLAASRKQVLNPQPTDLVRATQELKGILQRILRENVSLELFNGVPSSWVLVDPSQLQQILMNLVLNALDAMPSGGHITVEIGQREIGAELEGEHLELTPGQFGEIVVSDNGEGMSEETCQRAFEPFFSTKGEVGTGLGLATVHGIVKQHGGNIWVYSEPGQGTTFKIYLPTVKPTGEVVESPSKTGLASSQKGRRILLVEDNDHVRNVVEQILKRAEYEVDSFGSFEPAISWLKEERPKLDLLLTDVVLPDANGLQLAEAVQHLVPSIGILYMSGYTDNVVVHRGILKEGIDLLQKPISARELLERIELALG